MSQDDAGAERGAPPLLEALQGDLETFYKLIWHVGDAGTDEDSIIEVLAALATSSPEDVQPGRERAWLLATLMRLLGANVSQAAAAQADLPVLAFPARPAGDIIEVADEGDAVRLIGTLQTLEKPERAAVVLVVQEGLTMEEGARIQGGSRSAFARRYAEGLSALDDGLVETLMGR